MKRLVGLTRVVVLLMAMIVFAGCVAGAIGVWALRLKVTGTVEGLAGQLDSGLGRASEATRIVRNSLKTVRDDVALVLDPPGGESLTAEQQKEKNRLQAVFFRGLVQRLRSFSEANVVAGSMLRDLQELPFGEAGRIEAGRLDRAPAIAGRLAETIRQVQPILGDERKDVDEGELFIAATKLDPALQQCEKNVDEWQADLDVIRADLPHMKSRTLHWLTLGSVAVTVVCIWLALSQVGLFVLAWKWRRGG